MDDLIAIHGLEVHNCGSLVTRVLIRYLRIHSSVENFSRVEIYHARVRLRLFLLTGRSSDAYVGKPGRLMTF